MNSERKMIYQLIVPEADGTEELRVLQWHKGEGQPVGSDELIVELETAKAVVEVRSPCACVLRKIASPDRSWAKPGLPLAWFSDQADEALQIEQPAEFIARWEVL